ncbi:MAG: hypothetical protein CSA40_00890 [Flavobacteriales bacterium]|nr:MAG: hypothetical protein CSA40_00890 [Flavobacteriales bacterium]
MRDYIQKIKKKDVVTLFWYILGVGVPMFVGFIKNTIFTRVFTSAEYGQYALVNLTFSFATIVFISWTSSILWRFYQRYRLKGDLTVFYSNLLMIYGASFVLLALFTLVYASLQHDFYLVKLIIYTALFYMTKELTVFLGILLRLKQKDRAYNLLRLAQSLFGFGVLLLLVFSFDFRIEAFLLSSFIIDLLIILYFLSQKHAPFSWRYFSKDALKEFLSFGSRSIIISLLLLGIASIDRYIISYYDTVDHVGIYNQLYNFSDISIVAVMTVLYGFINPILTLEFETNLENAHRVIKKYFLFISAIVVPIVLILSVFAKPITALIFHESFAQAYGLVPYVLVSAYLYGLVNLVEFKLKFEDRLNLIIGYYIICLVFNVVLNLVFIPRYGYSFAAIATLLTYILMFVLFYQSQVWSRLKSIRLFL